MKIDGRNPQVVINLFRDGRGAGRKPEGSGSDPQDATVRDEVAFSPTARLAGGRGSVSDFPGIRSDKVNELKEKIQSGEYRVSGNAVAEKMLEKLKKLKDPGGE